MGGSFLGGLKKNLGRRGIEKGQGGSTISSDGGKERGGNSLSKSRGWTQTAEGSDFELKRFEKKRTDFAGPEGRDMLSGAEIWYNADRGRTNVGNATQATREKWGPPSG